MRTCVIYARFSSSKQREASIEDQLRVCREYAEHEGFKVIAEYSDYAMSGRTDARPSFQRMIANAGESDIVLVYMLDRFSRDPFDAPLYKHELAKHGVSLVSAMESIPDSPEGIIYEKLLEGLAACESAKTAVRVKRGMEGNALKCLYNGYPVYGYDVDPVTHRYVINETEASYVREAFQRRLDGEAANSIARDFAARGVVSSRGRPCGSHLVSNMLKNERYLGIYIWGDVRVDGGMPAIIDRATFDAVQVAPRARRDAEAWRDYPLAGKSICGCCGANMQGGSANGHGGRYYYYRCGASCGARGVRADWLEEALVDAVRELLYDRDEALRIAREVATYRQGGDTDRRRAELQRSRRSAQADLDGIMAAIKRGAWHPAMQAETDAAQERLERAERDLALLDAESSFSIEDFADFLQWGATLDDETVLSAFIGQVLIVEEGAVATLNYDRNNEPARVVVSLERVRGKHKWWATGRLPRTSSVVVLDGRVLLLVPRAA